MTATQILLPLAYARDKGIFTRFGLEPTLQVINTGSVPLAALSTDQLQVLSISAEGIAADLQGEDFVYIYSPLPSAPFSLFAKPEVATLGQLKGKKLAVSAPNSSSEALAKFALRQAGLSLQDTQVLHTGSPPNAMAALVSGSVDAAVFSPPNTFQAEAKGFHELLNGLNSGFAYLGSSSLVKRSFAAQNHDLILSYLKVMISAEASITKDKTGAIESLPKATKVKDPKSLERAYEFYAPLYAKYQSPLPPVAAVRGALDDLAATIPAAKGADPGRFIDPQFMQELQASGFIKQAYGA